jgi:hypothetical protein
MKEIIEKLDYNVRRKELPKWTVRETGSGKDRSDYAVVRVFEDEPVNGLLTQLSSVRQVKFQAKHPLFRYRQEARDHKKRICKERKCSNDNSFASQYNDESSYYYG